MLYYKWHFYKYFSCESYPLFTVIPILMNLKRNAPPSAHENALISVFGKKALKSVPGL